LEPAGIAGSLLAALRAEILLLGGSKSPAYLDMALDALEHVLPHLRRVTLTGLRHTGPETNRNESPLIPVSNIPSYAGRVWETA
jgi:hypothetical protein